MISFVIIVDITWQPHVHVIKRQLALGLVSYIFRTALSASRSLYLPFNIVLSDTLITNITDLS